MRFETPEQMLKYINDNHDLYSRDAEVYVFKYNEVGSICVYNIDKEEAKELATNAKIYDEYWAAFLGVGGHIYDDPSHDCYLEGQATNLDCCASLIKYDDWILTNCYQVD